MKIKRTANAGVLLETDDMKILLDGVCEDCPPYIGTSEVLRSELLKNPPDVLGITHKHKDHYDEHFVESYKASKLGSIIGPEFSVFQDPKGKIKAVPTRHIGKSDVLHTSFVIIASKCVWFMGDASPLELKKFQNIQSPDVLIVPYAYAITESAWKMTKNTYAKKIVVLHLPERINDKYKLWNAVENTVNGDSSVIIPNIEETIEF